MGTTLQNGVYLPNEGERNCYAGLKTNWEILDQKVADVTALQQAVAGALHREIVESLPTTDIDPNTIYMILSGTSATENVYNEFMYVNNAWELIGTSATDLTNYYTKAEVDGKLLLKASASDLTSHTGDTTIHVTASDKTKWNTVALIKQLRLVNTQVGSATTIAFANIDDTNGIKVGDKCMDLDGRMFEITAVDTTNQTVTVGSALVDLALDANVVHLSGDETITGTKTFENVNIQLKSTSAEYSVSGGYKSVSFHDKNLLELSRTRLGVYSSGFSYIKQTILGYDSNNQQVDTTISFSWSSLTKPFLRPDSDNLVSLGTSGNRWKDVYATKYYYGADNVEFSTKFVTTDTSQVISSAKTFASSPLIYNSDATGSVPQITFKNSKTTKGSTTETGAQLIYFTDKNDAPLSMLESRVVSNGCTTLSAVAYNFNDNQNVSSSVQLIKNPKTAYYAPGADNDISLGRALAKWSDVQTYKVNGLVPSSLSLPDIDNRIDISSYITDLTGNTVNTYSPVVNGYIVITCNSTDVDYIKISNNLDFVSVVDNTNNQFTSGLLGVWQPCVAGIGVQIRIKASALNSARFIPCQGNI